MPQTSFLLRFSGRRGTEELAVRQHSFVARQPDPKVKLSTESGIILLLKSAPRYNAQTDPPHTLATISSAIEWDCYIVVTDRKRAGGDTIEPVPRPVLTEVLDASAIALRLEKSSGRPSVFARHNVKR